MKERIFLFLFLTAVNFLLSSASSGRPPRLIETPADSVVPRNEAVTLNCRADGEPNPEITWLKDGKPIRAQRLRNLLPSGALFFLRVRTEDAGLYACVATNSFGEVTSRNATLDVAILGTDFRISPQNTWAAEGDTASLECEPPRGSPEPKVSWKKNGSPIDINNKANQGRYKLIAGSGSLRISSVRQSDEGRYVCVAKNIVGSRQSGQALLRVTVRPSFTIRPANTTALLGGDVSLSCVAKGDPPPEITWIKIGGGGHLPFKRVHFDEERFLISNVEYNDSGLYNCVAENKAGSAVSSASIQVLSLPTLKITPPTILEIQPNMTATFNCVVGGDPPPTLFWMKEGGHDTLVFQGSRQGKVQVSPQGTLQIDQVSEREEGRYFCAAVSLAGAVIKRVQLKVTPLEELPPPIILMGPSNQSRPLGEVAVLPCIVSTGNPPPIVTWYKDGESFLLSHRVFTDDAGTLRINDLEPTDSGLYECVASSQSGKYVWKSSITVDEKSSSSYQGFGDSSFLERPFTPGKPFVVKVDSSSVTISWQPEEDKSRSIAGQMEVDVEPIAYIDDDEGGMKKDYESESDESESPFRKRRKREEEAEDALFFKALSNRMGLQKNDEEENEKSDGQGFDDDEVKSEMKGENSEEYEYFDGDGYEEGEEESDANILVLATTTTTSTTTKTTTTTTATKKPTTNIPTKAPTTIPLTTYKVEYYSTAENKQEWLVGAVNVAENSITFNHLKPNAEYIFFIRAVSPEGLLSAPSALSDVVKTGGKVTEMEAIVDKARQKLEENVVVILKNVYATSSTGVRIEWQIVSASQYVEGFYIYYKKMKVTGSYQMLTVLNAGGGTSTFQIQGLDKFTNYKVFLVPFYKNNVEGRPSNYWSVVTDEDVPSGAPELIEPMSPVNSSAVIVRWKPPKEEQHNGIILGYQLRVWLGSALIGNKTTVSTSVVLSNLSPKQTYSLQVGAFTVKGVGVFSPMKTLLFSPLIKDDIEIENAEDNKIHEKVIPPTLTTEEEEESNKITTFGNNSPAIAKENDYSFSEDSTTFIVITGSIVFTLMLLFVVALYLRRCQIDKAEGNGGKFKVPCEMIPDGSLPPHYTTSLAGREESLWIDGNQKKQQLTLKSIVMGGSNKGCGENEYENANNYAVVEERHSPIAYASTTLINSGVKQQQNKTHKSTFSVFGGVDNSREFVEYNKIGNGRFLWNSSSLNHSAINNVQQQQDGGSNSKKHSWLLPAPNNAATSGVFVGGISSSISQSSSSQHSSASSEPLMMKQQYKSSGSFSKKMVSSDYSHNKISRGSNNYSSSRPPSSNRGQLHQLSQEDDEDYGNSLHNEYMNMEEAVTTTSSEGGCFFDQAGSIMGGHVLTTFQQQQQQQMTPVMSRKQQQHLVVDFSQSGSPVVVTSSNNRLHSKKEAAEKSFSNYASANHNLKYHHHPY